MRCVIFFTGCLAVLMLAGCSEKATKEEAAGQTAEEMAGQTDRADSADAGTSPDRISRRGPDGEWTTAVAVGIPINFPKDVPLYKNMEVLFVHEEPTTGNIALNAKTQDSSAKVAEFYKKEAESNGWAAEPGTGQGGSMLTYTKGDRKMMLVLETSGGATNIRLALMKK